MNAKHPALVFAVAACSFAVSLGNDANANTIWIQVTPAGDFLPSDGRDIPVDSWHIDALAAQQIIARFNARTTPPVIDYEHQTLLKEDNGQPAPAAAWFKKLEWREGQGLFAQIELTARARDYIASGEYQYFSPVLRYSASTGVVTALEMGAFTNNPAIHGMDSLDLLAAASFALAKKTESTSNPNTPPESTMKELLAILFTTLNLAVGTNEKDAITALTAYVTAAAADPLTSLRTALGQPADADAATLVAACSTLQHSARLKEGAPDPAKFVSVDVMRELQDEVAALSSQVQTSTSDTLITDALADGRLRASQKGWAESLALTDIAALTAYIDNSEPIAALTGQQSKGKKPDGDDKATLTADEIAVCSAMGIDQADFLKTKTAAA